MVELRGDSMQPGLPRGCRLRVEPCGADTPLEPGQLVALRGPAGLIVHRLVWSSSVAGELRLVHRGDAGGRLGLAPGRALVGQVTAVLDPALPLPTLQLLAPEARAAFGRAQRQARWFLTLARLGRVLARLGLRLERPAAWLRSRLLS